MHFNEGRISQQLEMKFGVVENAINKLIGIVSTLTIENQKLQRRVDQLARAQGSASHDTKTETTEENYELDISQVQKILKQQQQGSGPQNPGTLGRRIINN